MSEKHDGGYGRSLAKRAGERGDGGRHDAPKRHGPLCGLPRAETPLPRFQSEKSYRQLQSLVQIIFGSTEISHIFIPFTPSISYTSHKRHCVQACAYSVPPHMLTYRCTRIAPKPHAETPVVAHTSCVPPPRSNIQLRTATKNWALTPVPLSVSKLF